MPKTTSAALLKEIKSTLNDCLSLLKSGTPIDAQLSELEGCLGKAELIHEKMQAKRIFRNTKKTEQLVETVRQAISAIMMGNTRLQIAKSLEDKFKIMESERDDAKFLRLTAAMAKIKAEIKALSKDYLDELPAINASLKSLLGIEVNIEAATRMQDFEMKFHYELTRPETIERIKKIFEASDLKNPDILDLLRSLEGNLAAPSLLATYIQKNPELPLAEVLNGFKIKTKIDVVLCLIKNIISTQPINKEAIKPLLAYILNEIPEPRYDTGGDFAPIEFKVNELDLSLREPYAKIVMIEQLIYNRISNRFLDIGGLYSFTDAPMIMIYSGYKDRVNFNTELILQNIFDNPVSIMCNTIVNSIATKTLTTQQRLSELWHAYYIALTAGVGDQFIAATREQFAGKLNVDASVNVTDMGERFLEFALKAFPDDLDLKFKCSIELCRIIENASQYSWETKLSWLQCCLPALKELSDSRYLKDANDREYLTNVISKVEYLITHPEHLIGGYIQILPSTTTEKNIESLFGEQLQSMLDYIAEHPDVLQVYVDARLSETPEIKALLKYEMGTHINVTEDGKLTVSPEFCIDTVGAYTNIKGVLITHNGRLYDYDTLQRFWSTKKAEWMKDGPNSLVIDPLENLPYPLNEFKAAKQTVDFLKFVQQRLELDAKSSSKPGI